jgi:hypothetical protein
MGMRRSQAFFLAAISMVLISCSSINALFATPTPTITSTPSKTSTPTKTSTSTVTATSTPTPVQDVEAFKQTVLTQIESYLAGEFAVLVIHEVSWRENTLLVDIQTSYGSDTFNIEAGYYLCTGIADLLINRYGADNIVLIAGSEDFSLAYRAVSIHGDIPHGGDMDRALLESLASEEISINDWFVDANLRIID